MNISADSATKFATTAGMTKRHLRARKDDAKFKIDFINDIRADPKRRPASIFSDYHGLGI